MNQTRKMTKRVHFIGSGYESIKFITVDAEIPNSEAFTMAEEWYKTTGQTFNYLEMEIGDYTYEYDFPF